MTLQPFPGFKHFTTHHCVTGSIRHIYEHYDYPISEEMLLGLGAGVGFIYWHAKGTLPFIGGRANLERPGEEGLEKTVGRHTGVRVESNRTGSADKAEVSLLEMLSENQPVLLVLDMGFLPYFDFGGEEYHFGYHAVVACGYDPEKRQVLLADRDQELHPVSLETLAQARGSKYKPFPPRHLWYKFDFSEAHPIEPPEFHRSIQQCVKAMLEPPIKNFGVKGIRKAAERIQRWPDILREKELRDTCINTAIMIDARGGTGGGLFRYMYGRYLEEVAFITGEARLAESGERMKLIGDRWEEAAKIFELAYKADDPTILLGELSKLLQLIADQEEGAWGMLKQMLV